MRVLTVLVLHLALAAGARAQTADFDTAPGGAVDRCLSDGGGVCADELVGACAATRPVQQCHYSLGLAFVETTRAALTDPAIRAAFDGLLDQAGAMCRHVADRESDYAPRIAEHAWCLYRARRDLAALVRSVD